MDPQNTTIQPVANGPAAVSPHHAPVGPLIGAGIIVVLLAIGGLYIWAMSLQQSTPEAIPYIPGDSAMLEENADVFISVEAIAEAAAVGVPTQANTSDDVAALEADLAAFNLNDFENIMGRDFANIN